MKALYKTLEMSARVFLECALRSTAPMLRKRERKCSSILFCIDRRRRPCSGLGGSGLATCGGGSSAKVTDDDNLTAVLYGVGDLRLEQRPIPEPKKGEVLLKMACVGICGSDVHYLVEGRIGSFIVNQPMVMGHEASGIVHKLGENVCHLEVGDRVAIEPGVPCRTCKYCKEGKYNLCPDVIFCATPPDDGNLTRYYTHAADFCYKLPDNVSLEEGALLEPLSVGVHACRRGKVQLGSVVLVSGAGPIGLVTLLCAKSMGATKVLVTDIVQHRLDFAKTLGADCTMLIEKDQNENNVVTQACEMLGTSPDVAIDCSGQESSVRLCILCTKSGGVVMVVGMGSEDVRIPLITAVIREVDILGQFRYCNDYPLALEMVASGKANVKPLITHNYKLEETLEAFETARTGKGNPVKIMIHCLNKEC